MGDDAQNIANYSVISNGTHGSSVNNSDNTKNSNKNDRCIPYRDFFESFKNTTMATPMSSSCERQSNSEFWLVDFLKEIFLQEEEINEKEKIILRKLLVDEPYSTNPNIVLSISRWKVIRVWKLRSCRDSIKNVSDNGPLARIFSVVTSVEVYDGYQNILIFFYNEYAKLLHQQLFPSNGGNNGKLNTNASLCRSGSQTNAITTLLSFEELPAYKCVIPYPPSKVVLGDCPYCICIGDISKARVNSSHKMRFDSRNFHLELLSMATHVITSTTTTTKVTNNIKASAALGTKRIVRRNEGTATTTTTPAEGESDIQCFSRLHIYNEGGKHLQSTYTSNETNTANNQSTVTTTVAMNQKAERSKKTVINSTTKNKKYTYLTLSDLPSYIHQDVNVYGVVLHYTSPVLTRKGEYSISVTLMDETNTKSSPITLIIFGLTQQALPQFTVVGDILRAHRVRVQTWFDTIQLVAQSRGPSSFITFRIQPTVDTPAAVSVEGDSRWEINSTSKHTYTFIMSDYQRCRQLWFWGQRQLSIYPLFVSNNNISSPAPHQVSLSIQSLPIADCAAENKKIQGDLVAMVTAILPAHNDKATPTSQVISPSGFLRLWDGTGPSLSDEIVCEEHSRIVRPGNDPPLAAILSLLKIIRENQSLTEKFNDSIVNYKDDDGDDGRNLNVNDEFNLLGQQNFIIEPPLAVCGRIVNCAVWEHSQWDLLTSGVCSRVSSSMDSSMFISQNTGSIHVGQFIRLRNVSWECRTSLKVPCLHVHDKSSCTPLMDTMFDIRRILLHHQNRLSRSPPDEYNKNSAILPETVLKEPLASMTPAWLQNQNNLPEVICATIPVKRPISSISTAPSDDCIYTLKQCLGEPAPASFSVLVCVIDIIPSVDFSSSLPVDFSILCYHDQRQGRYRRGCKSPLRRNLFSSDNSPSELHSSVFHFGFVLKDDTAKLEVAVPNALAESLLGVTAAALLSCYQDREFSMDVAHVENDAVATMEGKLKDIVLSGKVFLGQIHSLLGGDQKFYVLESITDTSLSSL